MNINDPAHQDLILRTLQQLERNGYRPDVIIFDNLSSLGGGIDENDNSALDAQLQWLLQLRHLGYAVILIHHAGKSGDQRGASRREDLLDTSIKLSPPEKKDHGKFNFKLEFVKTRGKTPEPAELEVTIREVEEGRVDLIFSGEPAAPTHFATLKAIYDGIEEPNRRRVRPFKTQQELADWLHLSKGAISKHMKDFRQKNLIAFLKGQGGIGITKGGIDRLKVRYPDIADNPPADHLVLMRMTPGDDDDDGPI